MNLVKDKWILTQEGLASLEDVYGKSLTVFSGDASFKISILRLLVCISTRALELSEEDWGSAEDLSDLGAKKVAELSYDYLQNNKDLFFMEGDSPFLQTPACVFPLVATNTYPVSRLLGYASVGSNAYFRDYQAQSMTPERIARSLLTTQIYSTGYKKGKGCKAYGETVSILNVPATPSFAYGCGMGAKGIHHIMLEGGTLKDTVFMNLLPEEDIKESYTLGLGIPYWEYDHGTSKFPKEFYDTYYDRLVPASLKHVRVEGNYIAYAGARDSMDTWHTETTYHYTTKRIVKKEVVNELAMTPAAGTFWRELPAFLAATREGGYRVFDTDKLENYSSVKLMSMGSCVKESMGLFNTIELEDSLIEIPIEDRALREKQILLGRGLRQAEKLGITLKISVKNMCEALKQNPSASQEKILSKYWELLSEYKGLLDSRESSKLWKRKVKECALKALRTYPAARPRELKELVKSISFIKRRRL